MWSTAHRVLKSHRSKMGENAIMKTRCPTGYHHNGFCGNSCTWAHDVRLFSD